MEERINEILKGKCFYDEIVPEQTLKDDLGLDSLSMVELIVELEEEFDIEIDESDLDPDDLKTVNHIYEIVRKYTEG